MIGLRSAQRAVGNSMKHACVQQAEETARRARVRYENGLATTLELLDAEVSNNQAQQALLRARCSLAVLHTTYLRGRRAGLSSSEMNPSSRQSRTCGGEERQSAMSKRDALPRCSSGLVPGGALRLSSRRRNPRGQLAAGARSHRPLAPRVAGHVVQVMFGENQTVVRPRRSIVLDSTDADAARCAWPAARTAEAPAARARTGSDEFAEDGNCRWRCIIARRARSGAAANAA